MGCSDRAFRVRPHQSQNVSHLENTLIEEWNNIEQPAIIRLIHSVSRPCQVDIAERGEHTPYYRCAF